MKALFSFRLMTQESKNKTFKMWEKAQTGKFRHENKSGLMFSKKCILGQLRRSV